ncbi:MULTISPECIES: ABC transporter ATP-binding protein [unclassified Arthrobacter]|uniref:ABC transporter ATP-binding protein n=1 Tax=unclassified Arthrobacter TaxID=235627 RepID=UPI001E4C0D47|nr:MULTISPECIES: ABC transporter ATP-binding protein [unclassified Arthrobacter]MCC9144071.1 ABC transporter ATP-binding protein [Arthrobacter sp. zg-Y919]MDK1275296.1 ABC transporter ATP-binding protein [Arthrobacter sp. zg.Y919]MDM7990929.1 ABC transporter ATP-binding protein [Arthrobacter sp. zg-Y877]WIB03309.1 ABC transporter ATP-binding protein [Arthrobacter sp. zg-Y919]
MGKRADTGTGVVAEGIKRSFGSVEAVRGMNFTAPAGEVTALIGPNGSGKTTLLLILASLLAPDAGTVRINGFDPLANPQEVRAGIGWMPDTLGTWGSLTAREILETVGAFYGMEQTVASNRAAELLETVHLTDFADKPARVFSRGQQQRLSLARALIHDPSVLLLDEPASGLDPGSRVDLRVLLRRLAAEGKTVVVSSHVLSELDEMADGAVFVARGETVKSQTMADAGAQERWYTIRSLNTGSLLRQIDALGISYRQQGGSARPEVQVRLAGEPAAAQLLRTLVEADVAVTAFAPAGGALEETYMSLDADRR